ncbi:uncharacterized protein LOC119655575 isoform X2 [Hermetia illucens]|uniref:uncharacterized protein LOC119655575 isoform X2 n=1 Tax=Hermetia illucens TaxID=343691 RepID=UPI0018CC0B57|nr:uncharacterized protein LOC119655575 isoform X2 [Hermetia illucens]
MHTPKTTGWALFALLFSNTLLLTYAYPQSVKQASPYQVQQRNYDEEQQQIQEIQQQIQEQQQQQQQYRSPVYQPHQANTRKFVAKPNALKKVALDDIDDDLQSNQISETTGFSWSNLLATFLQVFFNNGGNSPTKSDDLDGSAGFGQSPWANVISVGLKIITTLLGGGAPNDGIDKVDNGGSPLQFINIVMNLLEALKTSFSHRSLAARSIGKRDSVSDAAVAGISMLKSYIRTYRSSEDKCMQKYLCDANTECISEIGGTSIFCQLGTYATSFILEHQTGTRFDNLYDAGRRGRSGENCRQIYLECNEV